MAMHTSCGAEEGGGLNEACWDRSSPAANMSPADHVTAMIRAGSELWPPMPHWMQTPSGKGTGNTSFKYKTTFWCLNI